MCQFFSFCTEPENHGGKRFYFDWQYRKAHLEDENDSHSLICKHFKLDEDVCNKYEFNPLTKEFKADKINSPVDDRIQAEDWVNKLDFKRVVEPLIVKPVVSSFDLPPVEIVTEEIISLLREWASVWASVWAYISSFFDIQYKHEYSSAITLWNMGIVPSYDGKTWRLHTGKDAHVIYEISQEKLQETS